MCLLVFWQRFLSVSMSLSVFRRCTPKVSSWSAPSDRCEDTVTTSLRLSPPSGPSFSGLKEKVQQANPAAGPSAARSVLPACQSGLCRSDRLISHLGLFFSFCSSLIPLRRPAMFVSVSSSSLALSLNGSVVILRLNSFCLALLTSSFNLALPGI